MINTSEVKFIKDQRNTDDANLKAMADAARIDIDTPRPDEPYILTIQGQSVASMGSFTTILGKAKSRKTFLNIYLAIVFLAGKRGSHFANLSPNKNTVLYFDTEQSAGEAWDTANRIIKAAGCKTLEKLKYYSLRPYTPEERAKFIDYIIKSTKGIGTVFIDGIRDLVNDINNPTEATLAATALLCWSGENHIHIFCTLHTNKQDNNARGHIGTELINKAQTIIKIEKASDEMPYSIVSFMDGRGQGFEPYTLTYDPEGLPIEEKVEGIASSKPVRKAATPESIPLNEHCNRLELIFNGNEGMSYKELQKEISEIYGFGANKAIGYIKYLREEKLTIKEKGKYFYKAPHQAKEIVKTDYSDEVYRELPF